MISYGIVGFGRIGQRLAARLPGAIAVLARSPVETAGDIPICSDLRTFLEHRPRVVVECASRDTLVEIGPAVLAAGCDLVPLSLTALVDRDVERRLMTAAEAGPGRIEIAPGAIGTLDLLATAREEGLNRVVYRQLKSPAMWKLVAAARGIDFDAITTRTVFRRGSVRALAADFANNLNTSVGVALAGLGLDRTEAELVADPALTETAHELEVHAAPGNAVLKLGGRDVPPDGDPVDYTTFSLMRLLRRRDARVAI
ncbi:aspartate dehydrogenase [soil metagenome]